MQQRRIAVAYSGGRDSTALLHATISQAASHGVKVWALHVHHGLSPNADAWLAHCAAQCRRWSRPEHRIEFVAHRLTGHPVAGDSIEAWARHARYDALKTMALANNVPVVLLGHHRRDQAETVLLQALRGAGLAGLSGMPRSLQRDGVTWQRPWLEHSGAQIEAYARRHRLEHIEDDSNADARFARNRLRLDVWPALTRAFGNAEAALATTAEWAQQARAALDELAALDLAEIATEQGMRIEAWLMLSTARRSNALRAWIKAQHGAAAAATLTARLLDELPRRRSARWPLGLESPASPPTTLSQRDRVPNRDAPNRSVELQLHRGLLRCTAARPPAPEAKAREMHLAVRRAGTYALPGWSGELCVQRVREGGVPFAWLAHLELRARAGGEQFQSGIDRPPRSLKKQYQSVGVPAWDRAGPLVYSGGQLIFVPGLGIDARVLGLPGQALAALRWVAVPAAG